MKAITKFVVVVVAGYPTRIALTVAAGLAQIGEFSFIVGTVGRSLGLLPEDGFQLIVAGALISITLNPLLLRAIEPLEARLRAMPGIANLLRRAGGHPGHDRRGHPGGPAAARDRVRLRPGRADDRTGARTARVPLRRHHPAAQRGRPTASAWDPGHLRRRRERRGPGDGPDRARPARDRGDLRPERDPADRRARPGAAARARSRRADAQRRGGGPPARR